MPKKPSRKRPPATRSTGSEWQAGNTSVSQLPRAERKARLGLQVTEAELKATNQAIRAAHALRSLQAVAAPPPAVDWRNNGGNWTTPIKDQQNCGSCVAFSTAATIESRIKIACRDAASNPDLSEAQLFFCGCGNCCVPGWNFAPALNFCQTTGVAKESSAPYTPNNQPCPSVSSTVKITAWSQVLTMDDRKNVIATKGPVIGGLAIYEDFYGYKSGVYRHRSGGLEGYHAVSVVGYDDHDGCWICKNSWGPGWGDAGYFRMAYGDESGMDTQFAFYDVDLKCPDEEEPKPKPEDDCRQYVPFLVRVLRAARTNPRLRACLAYYICRMGRRPLCSSSQIQIVRLVLAILRRCPQYLEPFCRALR